EAGQPINDATIVDDRSPHVDWRTKLLERILNGADCTRHACAETARIGQQQPFLWASQGHSFITLRCNAQGLWNVADERQKYGIGVQSCCQRWSATAKPTTCP